MPIYKKAYSVDTVNFSTKTVWEKNIHEGNNFNYFRNKMGYQYILEATDLLTIEDCVYDFVLGSHCLEHIANPIKAIFEWKRVLKPGGVIVLILPEKSFTFDHRRQITSFDHLLEDFNTKVDESDLTHLDEILDLHDRSIDIESGTKKEFKDRDKYTSSDIKVLELACKEAEKQRGKCEKNIEKLRVEILGIQTSKAFNYLSKAKIEEIKDVYDRKVQEIAKKIVQS